MSRIVIVHGWESHPDDGWFPWLKQRLEREGHRVEIPSMPEPDHPRIKPWVEKLRQTIGNPDNDLYLIGHSVGCQTILRYLGEQPAGTQIGGTVLVTPWLTLKGDATTTPHDVLIALPWLTTSIQWEHVRQTTPKNAAIFTANDPYVPLENAAMFENKLTNDITILPEGGHLSGNEGVVELPIVCDRLQVILKQ